MEINPIIDLLQNDERIKPLSRIGFCRIWVKEAILIVHTRFPDVKVEAREVDICPGLQHTFLRIVAPGVKPMLLDGTGVGTEGPYFGYEDKAPKHLQNSHLDMINNYVKQ